ncbi:ribosome assembly protein 4 [Nematocida sp. AWRm80]|nr:ribosome assembly protein 4 [Nematocida sp. AWRm80]
MNTQVIAQFFSQEDQPIGASFQLPPSITLSGLQTLLAPYLEEDITMRMFVLGSEIVTTLESALKAQKVSTEEVFKIYCYPDEPPKKARAPGFLASSCSGHKAAILSVKQSPCGTYICSSSGDGTVRFWCGLTKSPIKSVKIHNHWIPVIAFSPDSKYLAAGSMDGGVTLLSTVTMEPVYSKRIHKDGVTAISWQPDSKLFATASRDSSAGIWNAQGHVKSIFHQKPVIAVAYFGEYLLSAGRECTIKVSNPSGETIQTLNGHVKWVMGLAVHNGKDLGQYIRSHDSCTLNASKSFFVSISDDKTAIIWRPTWENENSTWRFLPFKKLVGHKDVITSVSIASSGAYIATSSFDRTIRLWTSMNGHVSHVFKAHASLAYQVAFSSTGNLLVSCSADKTVKVYSVEKGTLLSDFVCKDQVFAIDIKDSMIIAGGKDMLLYFFT